MQKTKWIGEKSRVTKARGYKFDTWVDKFDTWVDI